MSRLTEMESKFVDMYMFRVHHIHTYINDANFNHKEFTCSQGIYMFTTSQGIYMCKFLVNIKEMCRKGKHQETIKENITSMV